MSINKKEQIKTELRKRAAYNIMSVSGEYFVAAELSRRGWIAVLTLKNTPNIDLIATTPDGKRTVNIQVKTRSIGNRQGWILNKNIESIMPGKNFYIAFVDLQGIDAKPDYYIIPKNLFAKWIAKRHKDWLAAPGRNGHVRVDNPIEHLINPNFDFSKSITTIGTSSSVPFPSRLSRYANASRIRTTINAGRVITSAKDKSGCWTSICHAKSPAIRRSIKMPFQVPRIMS